VLHRFHDAAAGGEFHGEIVDIEQRLRGHGSFPINISSCAGLTRASIKKTENLFQKDGLPGQARQ
jgi:hypothetical protein